MQQRIVTTVTSAASSYDLTTLANVKAELSVTVNSQDTLLKRYITSASAAAAQYCNRKFQVETVQDEVWPAKGSWPVASAFETLQLARWPVVAIVSLTEDGTVLVEDTDFIVDYETAQLTRLDSGSGRNRRWDATPKVIQYQAGYAQTPADVEDAVIRMVSRRYAAKGRDPNLKQENVVGVLERSWWIATGSDSGNMSPDISDILDNYRVPVVA